MRPDANEPVTREAVSLRDAATLMDVHYETVRRLVAAGDLHSFRIGRIVRIRRADLVEYWKAHSTGAPRAHD
jgi:excisionase family DNA binding protein